jgi:hypothetical protein
MQAWSLSQESELYLQPRGLIEMPMVEAAVNERSQLPTQSFSQYGAFPLAGNSI